MRKIPTKDIYLDYAASAPLDEKVAKSMIAIQSKLFANPSSIHKLGLKAGQAINDSRAKIASLIFAHPDEIIFTGSGSESNVLAIFGVITNAKGKKIIPHIITSSIEHPSILENCRMLEKSGVAEVTYVDPDPRGIINPKDIRDNLKNNTVLVSIMYANNEIGTIQPIKEIAKVIRHFRKLSIPGMGVSFIPGMDNFPYFHSDACQAMNYLETENIESLGVDLMTWNSSKIYGPKGVGILYKKRNLNIEPIYFGGGQEFGLRPGTENTVSIVGAALAFEEVCKMKEKESKRLIKIRDYGIAKLLSLSKPLHEIILNGDPILRLPNNINISISNISSELLVIELDAKGIYVSAKSACKSDEPDESYVISALRHAQNIKSSTIDGSLRISLGRQTSKSDIDALVKALKDILLKYKKWK